MCNTPDVQLKKTLYLAKYNPSGNDYEAFSSSLKAAVQHNRLYRKATKDIKGVTEAEKWKIKLGWKNKLNQLATKYNEVISKEVFENDILELQAFMNENFIHFFSSDGFKVSHAQKSLSVYLKILWLKNDIKTPPLCPVDNVILAKAKYNAKIKWTKVNTLAEYRSQIQELSKAAKNQDCGNLACWELCNYTTT